MKKRMFLILGCVIVIAAAAAMILFVLSGDNSGAPVMDLTGNWKVVMSIDAGMPTVPANDTVVFEGEQAAMYRDGEVFASSAYSLEEVKLDLPAMSRSYDFTRVSDNLIKLIMTADNGMYLYRISGDEFAQPDTSLITGKWDVLCHGGTASANEYLTFEDGVFSDYQNGKSAASAAYTWNGDVLSVSELGMEMQIVVQTENRILMAQNGTSYIWELQKAAE